VILKTCYDSWKLGNYLSFKKKLAIICLLKNLVLLRSGRGAAGQGGVGYGRRLGVDGRAR
jgi:hypothetical protein